MDMDNQPTDDNDKPQRPKHELRPKSKQKWEGNEKLTFGLTTLVFIADALVVAVQFSRGDINAALFSVLLLAAVVGLAGLVGAWHFKRIAFFAVLGALVVATIANVFLTDWVNVALHAFLAFIVYGLIAMSAEVLE